MAKSTPGAGATPVAPGVDPVTPVPIQDPQTLGQTTDPVADAPAATDAEGVKVNDQSPNLTKEDDSKALPGNGSTDETQFVKVKTKEHIVLMDPFSAKHIDIEGAEVPVTSFINDELAEGGRLEKA